MDEELRKHLGGALAFHEILNPTSPPEGVVKMMKLAQNYMKTHVNEWTKAVNLELTRIQRLRERQQQVVGLVGVAFVTLGQIWRSTWG